MIIEDYESLKEMLVEFRGRIKEISQQTEIHTERIQEIEARLKVYRDAEPEDFKVFSPRKMEAVHREEIEEIKKEKTALEEQNAELQQRKETLERYAGVLTKVLKVQGEYGPERKSAEGLRNSSIETLDHLVHKIEQSGSLIIKNPLQAKQDLAIAGRNLKDTVDRMRDTVWIM